MMSKVVLIVTVAAVAIIGCSAAADVEEAKNVKDSYLAALKNSHKINALPYKGTPIRISRGDYNIVPSSSYDYSVPAGSYGPPTSTGNELYQPAPHKEYGPPAPKPVYGPPKPIYGPPPPPPPSGPVSHGMPYFSPENWLLSKLKFKFDLFTIGKILLKLVIFKKIVKFIALLCLLFFIPTLKPSGGGGHSEESSEEERRRSYDLQFDYERRLGEMTKFGLTALEAFTVDNALYCPEENLLSCRFKRMFDVIDESYPVSRIYTIYLPPTERDSALQSASSEEEEHDTRKQPDSNVGQEEEN
ncbi:AGAP003161-PA [Anopheles gambiae str. PEST]|uniref:AGAP003161-PA n=1 Tax=Anopheles gambiae TaxID=7165 RepID=Q7QBI4_ANOGA|nr:AGAP003161-PA [Anopheles gambiae str. PEST]